MLRGESLLKKECFDYSDETLEEFYVSEGMSRKMAKVFVNSSKIENKMISKIKIYDFNEEEYNDDYNEDDYNVFTYDTLRYPPGSTPHKTLN